MTDRALALFVKAPVPGRCKTRLVPFLTAEQAAELYRAFCRDVLETLANVHADIWIAYQSHPDLPNPAWLDARLAFFEQRGASLGDRLIQAFDTLFAKGYEKAAVIGTDAPSLPAARIAAAFAALDSHAAVFGPAEDGGYYLAGLTRPLPALFQNIPWSTENVLHATRRALEREKISAAFLPAHYDVDDADGLKRLAQDLASGETCAHTRAYLKTIPPFSGSSVRRTVGSGPASA